MTHIQLIEVQLAASRGQGCSKNATNNHVDIGYSLMFLSRSYLSCRIILFKVILIPSRTSCRWFTMNIYIYTPETKLQNVSQYKTLTQHNTILCISCVCPNSNLATKRWTTMVRPQGGDVFFQFWWKCLQIAHAAKMESQHRLQFIGSSWNEMDRGFHSCAN